MKIDFVEFDEVFLDYSFAWLSDPVTAKLADTPPISKESQLRWFRSLGKRKDYYIYGITCDQVPIGAAGLKDVSTESAEVFWYIGDKSYQGKGLAPQIAEKVFLLGIDIGLKEVTGNVLVENYRSINLLFKVGFKITSFFHDENSVPRYMIRRAL